MTGQPGVPARLLGHLSAETYERALAVGRVIAAGAIADQPAPVPNDGPPIQDLVIEDMEERKRIGQARYGTLLQAHNGRDALVDLYQELLDACCYIRQLIAERTEN